jgi:DNA-directed RNA polymerase specialized sigma24 family protein
MRRLKWRPVRVTLRRRTSRAARKGDDDAWEQIIARYPSLINAVCRRHRLASYEAPDVSQYVWMQLVRHINKLREPRALCGWISATATHRCYEILRTHKRSVIVDPLAIGSFDLVGTAAKSTDSEGLLVSTTTSCAQNNATPSGRRWRN